MLRVYAIWATRGSLHDGRARLARRDDDASAAALSLAAVSASQLAMESHQHGKRSGSNSAVSAAAQRTSEACHDVV